MNNMMDAYNDDKVYVIKSLTLETNDEAAGILGTTTGSSNNRSAVSRRRTPTRQPGEEAVDEEEQKVNVKILGVSNRVTAEIKFEYIIYIGEEIKGK